MNKHFLVLSVSILLLLPLLIQSTAKVDNGPFPGAPTYTVWSEDNVYYAKNRYNEIVSSTVNASQLFTDTINSLVQGGTVQVLSGTYTFSNSVVWLQGRNDVCLTGETLGSTLLNFNVESACFVIGSLQGNVWGGEISNLRIEDVSSKDSATHAFHCVNVNDFLFQNLVIRGFRNGCAYEFDVSNGNFCGLNTFINLRTTGGCRVGVKLGDDYGGPCIANTFVSCSFVGNDPITEESVGIYLAQANGNSFTGQDVEWFDTGIIINGSNSYRNTFSGLRADNNNADVNIGAQSNYNCFVGGVLENGWIDNSTHTFRLMGDASGKTSLYLTKYGIFSRDYSASSAMGIAMDSGMFFGVPQVNGDPNTNGWDVNEEGYMWFNTAENTLSYWNGTAIVDIP